MRNSLATLRAERGLTQADVASRLGVSRQTVISIERGRYDPSLPLAFRIARLFDVPIEAIFEGPEDETGAGAPRRSLHSPGSSANH